MSSARSSVRSTFTAVALAGPDAARGEEYPTVPEVAALLPPVEAVDALPRESLPGFIAGLAALQARAAVRLAVPPPTPPQRTGPERDRIFDVAEVAKIVGRSVSWVRRHGHKLPGFAQPGGKGCKVSWSCAALEAWARGETSPLTAARKRA